MLVGAALYLKTTIVLRKNDCVSADVLVGNEWLGRGIDPKPVLGAATRSLLLLLENGRQSVHWISRTIRLYRERRFRLFFLGVSRNSHLSHNHPDIQTDLYSGSIHLTPPDDWKLIPSNSYRTMAV